MAPLLNSLTDGGIIDYRQQLDEVIDEAWEPPVTLGVRLVSIIDDASQHSGQAVYARRLLGLPG